jgi:hypothetical protein
MLMVCKKFVHLSGQSRVFRKVTIIQRKKNFGLAKSIISGVSQIIEHHGKVIVLEDDLVSSPSFITYMNRMLENYVSCEQVFSISGYSLPHVLMPGVEKYPYDIYFCPRAGSWGWATWKDRWKKADWKVSDYKTFFCHPEMQKLFNISGSDKTKMLIRQMNGEIDSWAIRWDYSLFKNNAYCIYPVESYIDNIGHDGTGIHCGKSNKFRQTRLNTKTEWRIPLKIMSDEFILKKFSQSICRECFSRYNKKNTFLFIL